MPNVSHQPDRRRRPRRWWLWLGVTAALLGLSYWASARATQPPVRVRIGGFIFGLIVAMALLNTEAVVPQGDTSALRAAA